MKKNKIGVSLLISYVLLIMLTVSLAGLVYTFIQYKTKLPDKLKCPEGVSVFLYNFSCSDFSSFDVILKNNGLFSIDGVNLKFYNSSICFSEDYFNFEVSETSQISLAPSEIGLIKINEDCIGVNEIEILPFIIEKKGKEERIVYCSEADVKIKVSC